MFGTLGVICKVLDCQNLLQDIILLSVFHAPPNVTQEVSIRKKTLDTLVESTLCPFQLNVVKPTWNRR